MITSTLLTILTLIKYIFIFILALFITAWVNTQVEKDKKNEKK